MAGFADLGSQIEYVKQSLGMGDPNSKMFREGNGWQGRYELYCVKCNVEVLKPFIDEKDPKKLKRCPKCKQLNELWSREVRIKMLQRNMDELEEEEKTMKSRKKKFKKYRKKYALKTQFEDLDLGNLDDEKGLPYKEHDMWICNIDLDEYLDNPNYVPRSIKEVTDRAWNLHAKYATCKKQMDIAIQEKQRGNDALKTGNFKAAIEHYGASIRARTDYKPSYNNRALAYMKLGKYNKVILHSNYVISMCKLVDTNLLSTDITFKAYLRRAAAFKCLEKYDKCELDLEIAGKIKPNDGSVKKLLRECKLLHKRVRLRLKLQKQCENSVNLNDFESVFNLSIEFLQEATSIEASPGDEWHYETGHSEELLRRLLIFLAKEKKFCVRFADNNGVELSLKYLRQKFKIIKKWKEKLPSLEKPFLLLNYCCEKDVNFNEFKNKKLQKLIGIVVLYTYGYFGDMPKQLQSISMRFVSVVCSISHIRDFVVRKHGKKLLLYFLKFQKKTNPEKQEPKAIRCLFESLQYLCNTVPFQNLLLQNESPYLYEVFFHSMLKYNESQAIKKKKDGIMNEEDKKQMMNYEQLQYAISVCLDGLGLLFDGGRGGGGNNINNLEHKQDENDIKKQELKTKIISHFLENKNVNKYMQLLCEYLHTIYKTFKTYDSQYNKDDEKKDSIETNKKECMRYFGQLGKTIQVFVALCRSNKTHSLLYKYSIHRDLISLISICKNPNEYRYKKMQPMLSISRNNILVYFDQIAMDKKFDKLFSYEFDNNIKNNNENETIKLPYFWRFICNIFIEEYKGRPHPQLMQQFAHFKSCSIRLLYRWLCRRVDATKPFSEQMKINIPSNEEFEKYKLTYCGEKKISYLTEIIIVKYFNEFFEWLNYNDLQVLANTPLVLRQLIIYCINIKEGRPKIKQYIKKQLTLKKLKDIMKLMRAPHEVIQYNTCLLMATINEFDNELAKTVEAMGALAILEGFNRIQEERQRQMKKMQQMQNPAIDYQK